MLKPDPSQKRQAADGGLTVLWRERQGGGREGLALLANACSNPGCECREVVVDGWLTDDTLAGVSWDEHQFTFVTSAAAGAGGRQVFRLAINIDNGEIAVEGTGHTEPWTVEWLRGELDAQLLGTLRRRFQVAKQQKPTPPHDWRKNDWTWWKPGLDVGWKEVNEEEDDQVQLDGKTYVLGDCYCVEPGCECEEIQVIVWREHESSLDLDEVGVVWVNPRMTASAQFHAHCPARALLKRVWAAWAERQPLAALLLHRQKKMRELAPEIHRLFVKTRPAKVGPNERCPCGSGKKYKRCCMSKR